MRGLGEAKDSKLMSPTQREKIAGILKKSKHFEHTIAYCYPKTIDRMNIYQAARGAMRRAVRKLMTKNSKPIILIDGNKKIDGLPYDQQAIITGDRKVFAIACASILAKVYRDRMMRRYAKRFPGYGFEKHMGYGTKYHYTQLAARGPSKIHRRSFRLG